MELRLPISQKQHAMFTQINAQIQSLSAAMSQSASVIMAGVDRDLPNAKVVGVDDANGVFELILDLPEPAAPKE